MSFPLVGNSKIRLAVENILSLHRLPHAILIDGEIGTGRHTLAAFLSRAAVCSSENIPCGECHNCHLVLTHNHPDITVIAPKEGKKNIAVAQIRALKEEAYIKPHTANSKVFIIDFADTLNEQSQNAILKVLEEPPKNTVFILIAENKASLLDTVISRCVTLTLSSPPINTGTEYLCKTTDYTKEDIESALKSTHQNVGKALLLLKGQADTKTSLSAKEFFEFAVRGDQWGMIKTLYPYEKKRVEADRFFKDLKLIVARELRKSPKGVRGASLLRFYNELTQLEKSLITNINLSLLFADLTATAKELIG